MAFGTGGFFQISIRRVAFRDDPKRGVKWKVLYMNTRCVDINKTHLLQVRTHAFGAT